MEDSVVKLQMGDSALSRRKQLHPVGKRILLGVNMGVGN